MRKRNEKEGNANKDTKKQYKQKRKNTNLRWPQGSCILCQFKTLSLQVLLKDEEITRRAMREQVWLCTLTGENKRKRKEW